MPSTSRRTPLAAERLKEDGGGSADLPLLTADTITEDQIREWESDVLATGTDKEKCLAVDLATHALLTIPTLKEILREVPDRDPRPEVARIRRLRRRARARLAEILREGSPGSGRFA